MRLEWWGDIRGLMICALGALAACSAVAADAGRTTAPAAHVLRTPDTRFADLPDFAFSAHYVDVGTPGAPLQMAYVEEGPRNGPTIVLVHGQPTWSYIWRRMIPPLVAAGYHVVAPDLIGYGRSDKPADPAAYTYATQQDRLVRFFDAVAPRGATLVVHDWGGLLALPVAARAPQRFTRLVVLDTSLNDGSDPESPAFKAGFDRWLQILATAPSIPWGEIVKRRTTRQMSDAEVAAYLAPFPDRSYETGPRAMSALIPRTPAYPGARENGAARAAFRHWPHPVLIAFSERSDDSHPGQHAMFSALFPKERIWKDVTIAGAGHFLQEDKSDELAALIASFIAATPDGAQQ